MPLPFVKVKVDNDDSDDMADVEVYMARNGMPFPEQPTTRLAAPPRLTVEQDLEPDPETLDCVAAQVRIGVLPDEVFHIGVWHNSEDEYGWVATTLAVTYERGIGSPSWVVTLQLEGFEPKGTSQPRTAEMVYVGQFA